MIRGTLNYFYTHNRDGSEKEEITLKQLANWTSKENKPGSANYMMTLEFDDGKTVDMYFLESCVAITAGAQNLCIFENFIKFQNASFEVCTLSIEEKLKKIEESEDLIKMLNDLAK